MFEPIKLIDIALSEPLQTIKGLEKYIALRALVRLHGDPLGYVQLPVVNGCCSVSALGKAIIDQHAWPIMRHLISNGLTTPPPSDGLRMADLLNLPPPVYDGPFPLVTVAVCTRDRSADLALCLKALCALKYPNLDLLVIDNAPTNDQTERLVREQYPQVRYICEPRPGLNWARNRAILEARGEIIAYTDDDVIVDSKWVSALAQTFTENPEVMAVTGLVVPYELETEAQVLFEIHSGFGRGFNRKWYRLIRGKGNNWQRLGTGQCGTGANMAYRRSLFDDIGYFDPALDVGTVTNGGGDLEMFYRVIREGYTLVYEPGAIVRHRHRRDYAKLRTQLANNGVGLVSYWVRTAIAYPDDRKAILRIGLWWLRYWSMRRLWHAFLHKTDFPRDLIMAEFKGFFVGLNRYQKARRIAKGIAESFGPQRPVIAFDTPKLPETDQPSRDATAVRVVELTEPLRPLSDVIDYRNTRIFITWNDHPLGSLNIANDGQPIGTSRLREMLIDRYWLKCLDPNDNSTKTKIWDEALTIITNRYVPVEVSENGKMITASEKLPTDVPVSIVVATLDRPDDLRDCLRHLLAQKTSRMVEIIVVDNNPASGLTPPVVAEFPGVVLVNEPRRGLAYARNAGFIACQGNIAIATDDDVRMPPDWLEKLVAPFARSDVMIVTGNTLPLELETEAQCLFEKYGGLGRGFERFEVNGEWFASLRGNAVPTWRLGATANAAFRTSIFSHPHIGLMDEALGPGMPSGVGEDTYLFYKVLKTGHTLVYEPKAYVWHRHRRSLSALQSQLYSYSKGHIAYHLTTLFRDQDFRALRHILLHLPKWRIEQITRYLRRRIRRRKAHYPWSFIWLEIKGNLAGPWALWQSRRRVKREGHSRSTFITTRNIESKPEKTQLSTRDDLIDVAEAYDHKISFDDLNSSSLVQLPATTQPLEIRSEQIMKKSAFQVKKTDYSKFVILGQQRTGSVLLQMLLASHSRILSYGEIFNPLEDARKNAAIQIRPISLTDDPVEYLENEVFQDYSNHIEAVGFKLFYDQAKNPEWQPLWDYLKNSDVKFIHLKRWNLLARYLSLQLALRSDTWMTLQSEQSQDVPPITLDPADCFEDFCTITWYQEEMDEFFKDNSKLEVIYEQLSRNMAEECNRIQAFLEVELQSLSTPTEKQRKRKKSEIIANYHDLKQKLLPGLEAGWAKEEWLTFFDED